MTIRNRIDALMARFGYVRAPAEIAPTIIPMTIQFNTDTSKVEAAKKLLEEVVVVAERAEAAVHRLNAAAGTDVAAANSSTTT